jgi:hypothetical protein
MRATIVLALAAYTALAAAPLWAAPITVSWTHPTSGVQDGAPVGVALADIASTTIEYSTSTSFSPIIGSVVVPAPASSTVIDRPVGTWCFRGKTTLVAAKGGQTSDASMSSACRTVAPGPVKPNPPTIIDAILAFLKRIFGHFA